MFRAYNDRHPPLGEIDIENPKYFNVVIRFHSALFVFTISSQLRKTLLFVHSILIPFSHDSFLDIVNNYSYICMNKAIDIEHLYTINFQN